MVEVYFCVQVIVIKNVQLNTKSAALFEEWRSKCNVTIANSETGQTIEVPVRIRMVSDTTSLLEG